MKRFVVLALIASSLLCIPAVASEDYDVKQRQGLFFAFDLGGGILSYNGSNQMAFALGLKIGGGINEHILIMGEHFTAIADVNGPENIFSGGFLSSQFFLFEGLYFRPGIGVAVARARIGDTTYSSGLGFAFLLAGGYELRLGSSFSLSPEIKFAYTKVEQGSFNPYEFGLDLRWYF